MAEQIRERPRSPPCTHTCAHELRQPGRCTWCSSQEGCPILALPCMPQAYAIWLNTPSQNTKNFHHDTVSHTLSVHTPLIYTQSLAHFSRGVYILLYLHMQRLRVIEAYQSHRRLRQASPARTRPRSGPAASPPGSRPRPKPVSPAAHPQHSSGSPYIALSSWFAKGGNARRCSD